MKKPKILENVKEVLTKHPDTRGDDRLLIAVYWRKIDKLESLNMEFVQRATSAESITRARRLLQAKGELLPSLEILEAREKRQQEFKEGIIHGEII